MSAAGAHDQTATQASIARAITAGATVVWCDWPNLDGEATAGLYLHVLGWAYSPAGIEEVVIMLGGRRFEPRVFSARPDVYGAMPDLAGGGSGFAAVIETEGWEPGSYELTVRAFGRSGHGAAQTGRVQVGPDAPYRAWLGSRPRARSHSTREDEASPGLKVAAVAAGRDPGITDVLRTAAADGKAVLLVEDRGSMAPHALPRIAAAMAGDQPPDVVYADEDAIMPDGERGDAFFKPGWSPELLLSLDYVGPLVALRPSAAHAALAAEGTPETIYEVLLSLLDAQLRVERIPEVLFTSAVPRVPVSGQGVERAIERLAARRGRGVKIETLSNPPGGRDIRWTLESEPLVSVVIPTGSADHLVTGCLRSLAERTSYPRLEVVIVDSSPAGLQPVSVVPAGLQHRIIPYRGGFNFSTAINLGARAATGEYLVLLNDDTEVLSPDWLERMLEHAQTDGVGIVGCKLLYPRGRIQHAGVFVDLAGAGGWHVHVELPADASGYRGMLKVARNFSAVTGACMMVGSDLFAQLGGFDEGYRRDFGDIDFCARSIERGRRVVWTPHAELIHHERSSFPLEHDREGLERFRERWSAHFDDGDPFYHPAFLPLSYEFPC